jgi:hypothetical protein
MKIPQIASSLFLIAQGYGKPFQFDQIPPFDKNLEYQECLLLRNITVGNITLPFYLTEKGQAISFG